MVRRIAFAMTIMALALPFAEGQSAIDFSGTWKMDPTRSESAHRAVPIGPVTLVIKQTATQLSIDIYLIIQRAGVPFMWPESKAA